MMAAVDHLKSSEGLKEVESGIQRRTVVQLSTLQTCGLENLLTGETCTITDVSVQVSFKL